MNALDTLTIAAMDAVEPNVTELRRQRIMAKPNLDTNATDVAAAAARAIAGACPFIGGVVAEAVNQVIPNQKLERAVEFLRYLDARVAELEENLSRAAERLQSAHGLDLFEEGVIQATRALTEERREQIANLLARSLTQKALKYSESKKLLNLLRELTDPELLFLVFYAEPLHMQSNYHRELTQKHPEILRPASRTVGIPQDEIDRGALRDSYLNTLVRMGLLQQNAAQHSLSPLGRLLLSYIGPPAS
jgi:hypothetical protein